MFRYLVNIKWILPEVRALSLLSQKSSNFHSESHFHWFNLYKVLGFKQARKLKSVVTQFSEIVRALIVTTKFDSSCYFRFSVLGFIRTDSYHNVIITVSSIGSGYKKGPSPWICVKSSIVTYPTQIWKNSDNHWRLEWFRVSQIRVIICYILISFMTKMMCCCFLNVAKSFNSYANNSIFGNRIKVPGYNNKIKIHPW